LTHTFLVLVTVELGHGVYRKFYTFVGGQRAEKFDNHWLKLIYWKYSNPNCNGNRRDKVAL